MDNLTELRESLTYVIPLQELLENEELLEEAINQYIKNHLVSWIWYRGRSKNCSVGNYYNYNYSRK